jgi:hypothetical protein
LPSRSRPTNVVATLALSLLLAACHVPGAPTPSREGVSDYCVRQTITTEGGIELILATYEESSPEGVQQYCVELASAASVDPPLEFKSCTPNSPVGSGQIELIGIFMGHDERLGDHSIVIGMVAHPAAVAVRVTWEDNMTETVTLASEGYFVALHDVQVEDVPGLEALNATGAVITSRE